jgi:transposase
MTTPKPKRKHECPAEFRAQAIQLVLTSDKPRTVIAQELGVGFSTLTKWIRQHFQTQGNPHRAGQPLSGSNPPGEQQRLEQKIRRLKRELEIVRQEREVLNQPCILRQGADKAMIFAFILERAARFQIKILA